ncbi:hypothetical protein RFI_03590 [Reticulomyxa filosa]|uniref:Uncharacterized protein n=1 Tax=Reticulomyxa filosa TaxID=46433 RepID=X6P5M8_RETFI|nr:hypothetical protein RFI_03590 [Reticulomyxa filosa]|eukprot:ETO33511.1 hypothetical protein RFI_03590 [Reticulomyxa filosa]
MVDMLKLTEVWSVHLTVRMCISLSNFEQESLQEKKEEIKGLQLSNKVRNPLVLLTGAMKYQQSQYLENVKQDFQLLQTLFQSKFNYRVFSTYNSQIVKTEFLTLNDLNDFISKQCLNLTSVSNDYDGLIFVWCGYGGFGVNGDTLITSDNQSKIFKEIQNNFIMKTEYFAGKPKIFMKISNSIENNRNNTFTIIADTSEKSVINFTKIFCYEIENNMNQSLELIIKNVIGQISGKEIVQSVSTSHSDIYLIPRSTNNKNTPETLDFRKHWNRNWRKANVEAAKIVEEMIQKNEQGLVVLIILNDIRIDGNVYVVNCELQCKQNANITTQLFITENAIVDQSFSPIQWNTRIHYDIPAKLQELENKDEECLERLLYDDSVFYLKQYLQICIDTFGLNHPYVVIAYRMLGLTYDDKGQYDIAIEFYEKALKIMVDIFGINYVLVAQLYHNLGTSYDNKRQYGKAIKHYETALKIRKEIFRKGDESIGDICWDLGCIFEIIQNKKTAYKYYEEAWKVYNKVYGEWDEATLRSKEQMQYLNESENDRLFISTF